MKQILLFIAALIANSSAHAAGYGISFDVVIERKIYFSSGVTIDEGEYSLHFPEISSDIATAYVVTASVEELARSGSMPENLSDMRRISITGINVLCVNMEFEGVANYRAIHFNIDGNDMISISFESHEQGGRYLWKCLIPVIHIE